MKNAPGKNCSLQAAAPRSHDAFTLIEMLVVIAIIGIVAALVVNMTAGATAAKRNAVINSQKTKLQMMIENYQSKLNYYPPDNGNLAAALPSLYDGFAATNPLLYELTGAMITNVGSSGTIIAFDGTTPSISAYSAVFERGSVNNSDPAGPPDFFNPAPQAKEYAAYVSSPYVINGLLVPVPLITSSTNIRGSAINFWHYDSSSTNRHNMASFDLWAEYTVGSKNGASINLTNGNW